MSDSTIRHVVRRKKNPAEIVPETDTVTKPTIQIFESNAGKRGMVLSTQVNDTNHANSLDFIQTVINQSPGCYQHDDGSADIKERYNFYVHGKRFLFATNSLGLFPEHSRFRQMMIYCITSKRFDQFILLLIFLNSIILALADYSKVNDQGDLDSTNSFRNAIVNRADGVFTTLFSIECTMKIIAMGMFGEPGAYLMDPWNMMDFIVVFIGILAVLPGIPNVSALRTFRVLRPLRSLNAVAGIKKLVGALLKSIPELLTVVAFLSFLFFLYGVIGVQLWSGALHARCRITPFPVRLDANVTLDNLPAYQEDVLANVMQYQCLGDDQKPMPMDSETSHDTSVWRTPRMCYWPIAQEDIARACAIGTTAFRQCPIGQTCGSDYDAFGNFRFTHPNPSIVRYVLETSTYNSDMNYGYISFDHIGVASLAIFQCITREGWSDIMYMIQDAGYTVTATLFFVSFIIFGSYFMLNLTLAVIWEHFSEASLLEAEEREKNKEAKEHLEKKLDPYGLIGPFKPRHRTMMRIAASPIRQIVRHIVGHWLFNTLRTILILLNTIILSLDQYPTDPQLDSIVEIISFALTCAFFLECALKIIGLGWKGWAYDRFNLFDALVVVLGIVEMIFSPPSFTTQTNNARKASSFSALRSFRLFALFKLARSWPSLQKLLSTMLSTIREVGNFSILFLLFMYIYALIGMQTFANQFRFDEYGYPVSSNQPAAYIPRANFDTMLWSMVTVFQILTGENWNAVLLDGWRSSGSSAVLYFVSLVVLGNFIILNLFLAILLGNFEESNTEEKQNEIQREELKKKARITPGNSISRMDRRWSFVSERESVNQASSGTEGGSTRMIGRPSMINNLPRPTSELDRSSRRTSISTSPVVMTPVGKSLYLFSTTNSCRKLCYKMSNHPYFDTFSIVLVIISTISLALDNPLNPPDNFYVIFLSWIDLVIWILFVVEAVVKIIAMGFIVGENAYLRNGWNIMDFSITFLSTFSLFQTSSHFKFVKTLRTFRALRPLRMINRIPGLKLAVSSLIASIPQILNVMMVCALVFIIFSILAVNNLKGKLYSCQGDVFDGLNASQQALITVPRMWNEMSITEQSWFISNDTIITLLQSPDTILTSRLMCNIFQARWDRTIPQSFDNVIKACQTFFELTTTEGWITIMLAAVDATEIDMQPIPNYREGWTFFFIAFILVGTFFVMQLFVGVVIENFNRMKEKLEGTYLLSPAQREWLMINDTMLTLRPIRKIRAPHHPIRRFCYWLAIHPDFDLVIMGCIIFNTLIMGLDYYGEENLYGSIIEYSNNVFTIVFLLEAMVKIIGLGRYYWRDSWNLFDSILVLGSLVGMLYRLISGSSLGTAATAIRSFRVGRLFRLVQTSTSLRQIFNTLLITLPSLVNIGGLLFLVFFIYAAMGVQLFAKVRFGELVTATANFQSIATAMVTLARCATGERWNDLMYELASQDDKCVDDPPYNSHMCGFNNTLGCIELNGCGSHSAYLYLYSFTLFISFILLNIFIAVVLEGFANEKIKADGILRPSHYENIAQRWAMIDTDTTGFIEWHLLPRFLKSLDPPMGFDPNVKPTSKEVTAFVEILDIPIFKGNKVFFNDVARRVGKLVIDEMSDEPLKPLPNMETQWKKYLVSRKVKRQDHSVYRVNQFNAALLLHKAVKAMTFRKEVKDKIVRFTELQKK